MKWLVMLIGLLGTQMAWSAGVKVEQAWLRATVPGQEVAGAYLNITSAVNARLVGVSSPVAASAQLHSMSMKQGVMEMRELKDIALPKNKTVKLAPGGMHVMLFDLKQVLKPGEVIPLTLDVVTSPAHHEKIEVKMEVRDLGGH